MSALSEVFKGGQISTAGFNSHPKQKPLVIKEGGLLNNIVKLVVLGKDKESRDIEDGEIIELDRILKDQELQINTEDKGVPSSWEVKENEYSSGKKVKLLKELKSLGSNFVEGIAANGHQPSMPSSAKATSIGGSMNQDVPKKIIHVFGKGKVVSEEFEFVTPHHEKVLLPMNSTEPGASSLVSKIILDNDGSINVVEKVDAIVLKVNDG
ncbi:hypothetical protein MA16_Dca002651 [Dendrobium catenatum]|uniref:Uncharacterized protein n=1 Tax=Dendrobium catenatum TaxID=906689 RepID=A0A2I0W145_9ASPA|nr:hypothetical protein MA16_Dca002651 [Dendrobium catenatum]